MSEQKYQGKVLRWVDGDTVVIEAWKDTVVSSTFAHGVTTETIIRQRTTEQYRLIVVDTPERGDAGYSEATKFCERVLPAGSECRLITHGVDDGGFGRTLADVFPGYSPVSMSQRLLIEGLAVPYLRKR